ncbi:MAG: serine/threonine protein kinase [bacterium]|nr:serine/threonine protein kinase [bacterium]
MGLVYKARQRRLDRMVALKILAPDIAGEPGFADRFTREAQAMAKLAHPNIVTVHDFGDSGGLYYFVMELVEGTNLRQLLHQRRFTPEQALTIVPKICDALQYAHDRGVVHRDIKPENVMVTRAGEIKIADFGLAKLVRSGGSATVTLDDKVIGTPAYMAPEQIEQPQSVDHRADIYSLGVVFYEMLTGELPLGRFAPPSRKVEVDVRLDGVVLRALEKERDRRYQRVTDVKTEINSVVTGPAPPEAQVVSPADPPPPRRLSRLALAGAICTGISLFGSLFFYAFLLGGPLTFTPPSRLQMVNPLILGGMIGSLIRLAGLGLSIAGWVEVVRSDGRIYGLWLAVPGALLPLTSLLTGSLFFLGGFR